MTGKIVYLDNSNDSSPQLTVAQLIELLKQQPQDSKVFYGDFEDLEKVQFVYLYKDIVIVG